MQPMGRNDHPLGGSVLNLAEFGPGTDGVWDSSALALVQAQALGQTESLDARLARVQKLLSLENDELYNTFNSVQHNFDYEEQGGFLPSVPFSPPTAPQVRDVRIVVKSLPGAGPRLPGTIYHM